MKQLQFTQKINASAQKVWFALWDDYHYRQWTSAFAEGSYAVTDEWKTGTKVLFLGPGGGGMYSTVTENTPLLKMHFTHLGEMKDYKELPIDDRAEQWTGSHEIYSLSEVDDITTLEVAIDVLETHESYFLEAFPKALELLKAAAEDLYIVVTATVAAPIEKAWEFWTTPAHVMNWNNATEDWHTPSATNDLRVDGKFSYRMAAKDGSFSFDFEGIYSVVEQHARIAYGLEDGRQVVIDFTATPEGIFVREAFHPESMNSLDMQRMGWQMILDNFKRYVEAN